MRPRVWRVLQIEGQDYSQRELFQWYVSMYVRILRQPSLFLSVDMTCPICEDSVKNFETTELMTRHLNEAEQHMEQFCLQKENPDTSFGQFGQRRRVTPISRNTVNISVVKDEHGKAIDGSYTGIIHHSEMFELRLFFLIWAKTTTDGVHFGISLLAPNDNKYHGELQAS